MLIRCPSVGSHKTNEVRFLWGNNNSKASIEKDNFCPETFISCKYGNDSRGSPHSLRCIKIKTSACIIPDIFGIRHEKKFSQARKICAKTFQQCIIHSDSSSSEQK